MRRAIFGLLCGMAGVLLNSTRQDAEIQKMRFPSNVRLVACSGEKAFARYT